MLCFIDHQDEWCIPYHACADDADHRLNQYDHNKVRFPISCAASLHPHVLANSLFGRYADITCAMGVSYYPKDQDSDKNSCHKRAEGQHLFDHPFVQALAMFIGEFCCLIAFYIYRTASRMTSNKPVCRALPAPLLSSSYTHSKRRSRASTLSSFYCPRFAIARYTCALSPTHMSLTDLGDVNHVCRPYADICQPVPGTTHACPIFHGVTYKLKMLRGSVIIFTGLLSKFFLGRKLESFRWVSEQTILCADAFADTYADTCACVYHVYPCSDCLLSGGHGACADWPALCWTCCLPRRLFRSISPKPCAGRRPHHRRTGTDQHMKDREREREKGEAFREPRGSMHTAARPFSRSCPIL